VDKDLVASTKRVTTNPARKNSPSGGEYIDTERSTGAADRLFIGRANVGWSEELEELAWLNEEQRNSASVTVDELSICYGHRDQLISLDVIQRGMYLLMNSLSATEIETNLSNALYITVRSSYTLERQRIVAETFTNHHHEFLSTKDC